MTENEIFGHKCFALMRPKIARERLKNIADYGVEKV